MTTLDQSLRIGAPHAEHSYVRAIADFALRIAERARMHIAASRSRREAEAHLAGMNDRDLRDIGLTRHELHRMFSDRWI